MLTNKIMGAGGQGGGGVGGEFISSGAPYLTVAPQAGDLMICHGGAWAGTSISFYTSVTTIRTYRSRAWSGSYYENSAVGYRICDGTEGANFVAGSVPYYTQALALYRFNKPVVSVTTHNANGYEGPMNTILSLSFYPKPHIAFATQSAYQSPAATTNIAPRNYLTRPAQLTAQGLLNTEETNYSTISWTLSDVGFNEANTWAIIQPNF